MVFNLIPLPPLDGGRVANSLLPPKWSTAYERIEPFGFLIVLLLLVSGVLNFILYPVLDACLGFFSLFAGISPAGFINLLGTLLR